MHLSGRKRRTTGYSRVIDPDGPIQECETFRCAHCDFTVEVKPMCAPEDAGGRCTCCDQLICSKPECKAKCTPLEKRLEAWERAGEKMGQDERYTSLADLFRQVPS